MIIWNKEFSEKFRVRREKQSKLEGTLSFYEYVDNDFDPNKFMNKFMQRIIQDEEEHRQFSPNSQKQKIKEKIDKFSQLVKDMHPPKISSIKKKEMKALKDSVTNMRIATKKDTLRSIKSSLNKSGNCFYLSFSKFKLSIYWYLQFELIVKFNQNSILKSVCSKSKLQ